MKKKIVLLLVVMLITSITMMFTGCSSEPYSKYDLTEYITLPDYNTYEVDEPEVVVTDDDVETEIQSILEEAATTEAITEGTVKEGDSVTISFEGKLADGTTSSGMTSSGTTITLGSAGYIDGFEEGLYGATIGETVSLDLQFPDPYTSNEELSGKDVTFEVTIISKNVEVIPEFNLEFVKEYSEFESVEEYKASLKADMEQEEYDEQLYEIKEALYTKIVENTTVLQYPEKEVEEQVEYLDEEYKVYAESYGYEWEDFMDSVMGMDEEGYNEMVELYAQEIVKQEMVIYLVAQNEGVEVSDEEYNTYLDTLLTSSGFESEDDFKDYTGMSLKKYAKEYKLDRDMLLTKELDIIYERLLEQMETE